MIRVSVAFAASVLLAACRGPAPEPQPERVHVDYRRAADQDKSDWSPLHVAALDGDMDRVVELVRAGADVRAPNPGTLWTPLHIAALYDKEQILKYLVEVWRDQYGEEPDVDGLLFSAVIHGNYHCVKYLLEQGGDPNGQRSHDFEPQLYVAASHGHLEAVALLLEYGADIGATTTASGLTALHGAAEKGLPGVILLVEHGANVNAQSANGYTPLHTASERGHADAAAYLLEHGADPDALTSAGRTPRDLALRNDRAGVLNVLDSFAKR